MYSTFTINIDIIKALTIIFTIVGASTGGAWYLNGRFSKIEEQLRYLEKTTDELRVGIKEISKQKNHASN